MIKTNYFELSKKEYFIVIVRRLIQKQWYVFLLLWLMAILFLLQDRSDYFSIFIATFSILYPIFILFTYWRFANAKENTMIFIGREHEIYPDKIITRMINGSESTIQLSSFVNAVEIKNVYLLYVNKSNSIFFPKRAFRQPEDELWFHNNVFLKIKSNRL